MSDALDTVNITSLAEDHARRLQASPQETALVLMSAARQGFIKHANVGGKKLAWICCRDFHVARIEGTLTVIPDLNS